MKLHINIEDLLSARTVESDRIEFKKSWNPDTIYRSICAFANDIDNTGGGYILIGVVEDEQTKTAQRPVLGLSTKEIAEIQKKMIGFNNLIKPVYHPKLSIESIDNKEILILWIPGGTNRPYQVPEKITSKEKLYKYYVRKYASTTKANIAEEQELISLANNIPFDDRANTQANISNISILLINDYLNKINSRLADFIGKKSDIELLGQMELISGPNEQIYPRNVALLMFSDNPAKFFPYTQVEIIEFSKSDSEEYIEYPIIEGPIDVQIKRTLEFLKDKVIKDKIIKQSDKEESIHLSSYPYQAIEEIIANCFYHRDYLLREPIEIRIYPNSIVFINQGGPDRSISLENFNQGQIRSRRYRNRRLGEFLKELKLTEGRATGIPTILKVLKQNGSPPPRFNTDEERSFFEVELFIHPEFIERPEIILDLNQVKWDINGINNIIDKLIKEYASGLAGGLAELNNKASESPLNQTISLIDAIDKNTLSGLVSGIAEIKIEERYLSTLILTHGIGLTRKDVLLMLHLSNSKKNSETYIKPLLEMGWIEMTIPDKPTSPKQKYKTTLKGLLVLHISNYLPLTK